MNINWIPSSYISQTLSLVDLGTWVLKRLKWNANPYSRVEISLNTKPNYITADNGYNTLNRHVNTCKINAFHVSPSYLLIKLFQTAASIEFHKPIPESQPSNLSKSENCKWQVELTIIVEFTIPVEIYKPVEYMT